MQLPHLLIRSCRPKAVLSPFRQFSFSSTRHAFPKAMAEATVFHDSMTQSFRDARLSLEPKQDEVFIGDYYSLDKEGNIEKVRPLQLK